MIADNTKEVIQEPVPQIVENASKLEEVLDTRTPEQMEADMLAQAEADAIAVAEGRDPAEIAAMCFHMFFPRFQEMIMFLPNKELKRLLVALIGKGHQSLPDTPSFKNPATGQAYKIGLELLQAKFMMITKLEMDHIQNHVDKQEAAKALAASAVIETQYGAETPEENSSNVAT